MNLETKAYQHALSVWQNFHSTTRISTVDGSLPTRRIAWEDHQDRILRALPPIERTPSAIGLFVRNARTWSTDRKRGFLAEFVPSPPPVVGELLRAAAMGEVIRPRKLLVTLEEFPSRIWQRTLASRSPERLVGASYLACHAMARLLERHRHDADLRILMPFWDSAGDLPCLIDLAALPPADTQHLKDRILERLMQKLRSGDFQPSFKDMESIKTWVLAESAEGPSLVDSLASEANETAAQRIKNGRLRLPYDTRRLGRLMFRLGFRRHSYHCANALGEPPWKNGWQHQVVSAEFHSRIRQRIHHGNDTWMSDPALACSSMTIPLWLTDGVERVSSLSSLFFRAAECPWMFPRLQHIYQWHLALAGKQEALREIAQLAPDLAAGLSETPEQA